MLATLLFTNGGIPYFLQGDEIGMTNAHFRRVEEMQDVAAINGYKGAKKWWMPAGLVMKEVNKVTRDHSRTPFQWNANTNAGFTTGASTWLKVNPNHKAINAQQAMTDKNSIWHYYKSLIALRKQNAVLTEGAFEDLAPQHPQVYAYTRTLDSEKWLVVLNMTGNAVSFDPNTPTEKLLTSNYTDDKGTQLRAFEAKVYKVKGSSTAAGK